MADDTITLEAFLLTVQVPKTIPDDKVIAILRILNHPLFQGQLRDAVQAVLSQHPQLANLTFTITQ